MLNSNVRLALLGSVICSFPADNLQAFLAYAKAHPGALKFGSAGVGSASNDAEDGMERETDRADILEFDPDGGHKTVYASGLRNASDIGIAADGSTLLAVVNERDGLGDDLPPDYLTRVQPGGFYGWPWYYIGDHADPHHRGKRPELAHAVLTPDLLIQPHSAPLGLAVYEGAQFPSDYKGDIFVALHGSWNRATRTGYKIVRVRMRDGVPTGEYDDFVTGFLLSNGMVWGRPVGVTVADGRIVLDRVREIALRRSDRPGVPFVGLEIVDRDERRLAAHGEANVQRAEIGVDPDIQ